MAPAVSETTSPSPLNAALVRTALTELHANPARQAAAQDLMRHAHKEAQEHLGLTGFQSQIMPILIGADKPTMALAGALQDLGYDIRAYHGSWSEWGNDPDTPIETA